jgi:ABC-type Na+ transport system ATPase subunit NatA
MEGALLDCERARVDVGGLPRFDGLTCATTTDRAALVGDWSALWRLLSRQARVGAGRVQVHGSEVTRAVADGVAGVALCDPPLPESWTVLRYVETSAALAGLDAAEGRAGLDRLGLLPLETRKLGHLQTAERRAVIIAHATLGSPPVIALESPLTRLEAVWQPYLVELVRRASAGRRLLVSVVDASESSPERPLLDAVDEVLVLEGGQRVRQGLGTGASAYRVVVSRGAPRFLEELAARGIAADVVGPRGPSARVLVHVEETSGIVEAALAAEAPILELVPADR